MGVFHLPDLGEGLTDAEIVRWLVNVGDEVTLDQPVIEVETAKAIVDVPVPYAGVVGELHCAEGDVVAVGAPLITIQTTDATSDEVSSAMLQEPGVVTAASGNVLIGYGTPEAAPRRRRRRASTPEPVARGVRHRPGVISPVVRRLARDGGVDLAELRGSGPDGVICRSDVERALAERWNPPSPNLAPNRAPDRAPNLASDLAPDLAEGPLRAPASSSAAPRPGGLFDAVIPLTGTRGYVADKLSQSRREIPEATVWVDVDVTDLVAARRALTSEGGPVSVLALLSRIVVAGLRRYPQLNARVVNGEVHQSAQVNLGFAAQTDRGLVVPVVHAAQSMTLRELAAALTARTQQAREGRLDQAALSGGTLTVNNYGVFGVDGSAAIINHPEAAIVGMGRIIERPWVVDGELAVRKISQLTIAFDHRVCDGGVAGGFLRYVADRLESPVTLLADL